MSTCPWVSCRRTDGAKSVISSSCPYVGKSQDARSRTMEFRFLPGSTSFSSSAAAANRGCAKRETCLFSVHENSSGPPLQIFRAVDRDSGSEPISLARCRGHCGTDNHRLEGEFLAPEERTICLFLGPRPLLGKARVGEHHGAIPKPMGSPDGHFLPTAITPYWHAASTGGANAIRSRHFSVLLLYGSPPQLFHDLLCVRT